MSATAARALGLVLLLAAIGAAAWLVLRPRSSEAPVATTDGPELPLPSAGMAWVNGTPETAESLRGHVVAYVVWTESEPSSLRLLPEAESWHQAYARYGLRVIGVHAPSFVFGADTSITFSVARRLGLTFPIVLDASYELTGAVGVPTHRPAAVIANPEGRIVFTETTSPARIDQELRRAIMDANPRAGLQLGLDVDQPDLPAQRLVHLGASRVERGPLAGRAPGVAATFTAQFRFQEEGSSYVPYVVGRWLPEVDGVVALRGGAANYISVRCDAGVISTVLSPASTGRSRVWILADDEWLLRAEAGEDVHFDGSGAAYVDVESARLYSIARTREERVLKLSPDTHGIMFYLMAFEELQR
jgi:hypothetical protein